VAQITGTKYTDYNRIIVNLEMPNNIMENSLSIFLSDVAQRGVFEMSEMFKLCCPVNVK
jgi:hypothetical protein